MAKPSSSPDFDILETDDVAELLLVTDRTIRNWLKSRNMPSISDDRGRRFQWSAVLPWYVKMMAEADGNRRNPPQVIRHDYPSEDLVAGEDIDAALLRKTIAEADLKELELATRRAQVVAIDDVTRTVQDLATSLRTELTGWPTLMIGRIFGMRDRNQLFAVLTSSARELCTRLAGVGAPDA
jgi:phage terminase Nu1 subunit (DNA packaging protein)